MGHGVAGQCGWRVNLWPFCASSRMVGGVQPSADGVGSSCFVLPSLGVLCSLGRGQGCW